MTKTGTIQVYLKKGLDEWFELVNNFWWNLDKYKSRTSMENCWDFKKCEHPLEKIAYYIHAGIWDEDPRNISFHSCIRSHLIDYEKLKRRAGKKRARSEERRVGKECRC